MVNIIEIKTELLNELRNADLISIAERGVTTDTDTFNGDNSTTSFDLSNSYVKNVRSVIVDSVPLNYGEHWTYSENKTTFVYSIEFITAPATGTNNIVINYDYGSPDRIFSEFSEVIVENSKMPRIHFEVTSIDTNVKSATGSAILQNKIQLIFQVYDKRNSFEALNQALIDFLDTKQKTLYYLKWFRRQGMSQILPLNNTNNKIFTKQNTYIAPLEFEVFS